MTNILGIIPTYQRTSAPKVAKSISKFCSKVIILAKDTSLNKDLLPSNCTVFDVSPEWDLSRQRQLGAELAISGNYEASFQVDDDIGLTDKLIQKLISSLEDLEFKAGITSPSRVQHYWAKSVSSTRDWIHVATCSQTTLVPTEILKMIQDLYGNVYKSGQDGWEDSELGLRMAKIGFPCFQLHGNKEWEHQLWQSRSEIGSHTGGLSAEARAEAMDRIEKYMKEEFLGNVLSSVSVSRREGKAPRLNLRYNWEAMCHLSRVRNGEMGYSDSRGRVL